MQPFQPLPVGPNVKTLKVGDRVAMEPGATCRKCDACKSGRYEVRGLVNRSCNANRSS